MKTLHRPYPERVEGTHPSFLKLRWMATLALGLALIVAVLSLQPLARSQTRKLLDGLKGVKADFSDVHVSIFPLRYRITRPPGRDGHRPEGEAGSPPAARRQPDSAAAD